MSQVMLFEHASYHGAHKHVFDQEPNLNALDDRYFNDKVSSLVVMDGEWGFYQDAGYVGQYPNLLGPGKYRSVSAMNIRNDDMSSLRCRVGRPS
ncbi:MAG: beta/gamma crystallin-related protein [Polyangiaceae bacterium]